MRQYHAARAGLHPVLVVLRPDPIQELRPPPPGVQYNRVQYSTIQYNKVQYSKVQYSTVQYLVSGPAPSTSARWRAASPQTRARAYSTPRLAEPAISGENSAAIHPHR